MERYFIWSAIWAGLIAGIVFIMLEMLMVPLFLDGSSWGPPRMIAAIIMGKGVLPPPASFALTIFIAALILHLLLSVFYTWLLAWLIVKSEAIVAFAIGIIFGIALYIVNFYGFTAIFPWFAMARNWVSLFSHAIFGIVAAFTFVKLFNRSRLKLKADK